MICLFICKIGMIYNFVQHKSFVIRGANNKLLAPSKCLWCARKKTEYNSYENMEAVTKDDFRLCLRNCWCNRGCITVFVYQCFPRGQGVFLFLATLPVPKSLDLTQANSDSVSVAPSHRLTASPRRNGAINLSHLMGTKGQSLIIHSGCQTVLAGCYLGWGRPIELFKGRILFPQKSSAAVQIFARVSSPHTSPLSFLSWPWRSLQQLHGRLPASAS